MKKLVVLALAVASLSAIAAHNKIESTNQNIGCRVVGVMDGDTIDCLTADRKKLRIRLSSIDAPEKSQDFGQVARKQLSDYMFGKSVIASIESTDKYGRAIAELFLAPNSLDDSAKDVLSVNYQMVEDGLAWVYRRYAKDKAYIIAEEKAREAKIGLWQQSNAINPEEFRRSK